MKNAGTGQKNEAYGRKKKLYVKKKKTGLHLAVRKSPLMK